MIVKKSECLFLLSFFKIVSTFICSQSIFNPCQRYIYTSNSGFKETKNKPSNLEHVHINCNIKTVLLAQSKSLLLVKA